jgi:hypothetical protein
MVSNVSTSEQGSLLLLGIDLHPEEKSLLILLWVVKSDLSGIASEKLGVCLFRICTLLQLALRDGDQDYRPRFLGIEFVFEVSCD